MDRQPRAPSFAAAALPLLVLAVLACCCGGTRALSFPHYMQCDPRWGSDKMGVPGPGERSTICGEGCAMTSLTMALGGLGITLPGASAPPDPKTLNAYLVASSLYECAAGDCNNLVLGAPEAFSGRLALVGETPPPPAPELCAMAAAGRRIFLAHVRNRTHFVLVTGCQQAPAAASAADSTVLVTVQDPNYNTTTYAYTDIADTIAYDVLETPRATAVPRAYPLFKQCDPRWGSDVIVTQTLCQVGCLENSISMALRGHGILINGSTEVDPGRFNSWLKANGGYTSGNDLEEDVVPRLAPGRVRWNETSDMHTKSDLSRAQVRAMLLAGRVVIANVMQGHHFVLTTGWSYSEDIILVNDPGFDRNAYNFTDVVGWRLFDMTDPTAARVSPYWRDLHTQQQSAPVVATATGPGSGTIRGRGAPTPPSWPKLVRAELEQNRNGSLALVTLVYDYANGRNLNLIRPQVGPVLYDIELANGTTFYFTKDSSSGGGSDSCKAVAMGVGVLRPDWLAGAAYAGQRQIHNIASVCWTQGQALPPYHGPFITYCAMASDPARPVQWVFYDGAVFDVMAWEVGQTVPADDWNLPSDCVGRR